MVHIYLILIKIINYPIFNIPALKITHMDLWQTFLFYSYLEKKAFTSYLMTHLMLQRLLKNPEEIISIILIIYLIYRVFWTSKSILNKVVIFQITIYIRNNFHVVLIFPHIFIEKWKLNFQKSMAIFVELIIRLRLCAKNLKQFLKNKLKNFFIFNLYFVFFKFFQIILIIY